jgi:polyisoprenoid-binding protein YceI
MSGPGPRARGLVLLVMVVAAALPSRGSAETMAFRLLPDHSRATFKSDSPVDVVVGHTPPHGIAGTLTLDVDRPAGARGTIRIDMTTVRTGLDRRDADLRSTDFLATDVEANRWATFEVTGAHLGGPLVADQPVRAKVVGILTVKQTPVPRVADATVTWIRPTPARPAPEGRSGSIADTLRVRARLFTRFTNHGMRLPEVMGVAIADDIEIDADLTFARE